MEGWLRFLSKQCKHGVMNGPLLAYSACISASLHHADCQASAAPGAAAKLCASSQAPVAPLPSLRLQHPQHALLHKASKPLIPVMPVHRYELAAGLSDRELADPGKAKAQSSWEAFMARRAKMQVVL